VYDSREIIYGEAMKKYVLIVMSVLLCTCLCGCSTGKLRTEKLRDVEFTVMDVRDVPEEFQKKIEEHEVLPFKLTYEDAGMLYIAVGYGQQESSGYSIEVKELYETENAIYILTNLKGPSKDEKVVNRRTYPYIVVKMESIEKNVVFK
jgi:hypothetical protein